MRITVPMGSRPGGYVRMQYQPKAPPPAPCIPAPCIPQQQPISQAPPTYLPDTATKSADLRS